jgi:hypothetical protein
MRYASTKVKETPSRSALRIDLPLKGEVNSAQNRGKQMCRNIRTLFNFEPPATEEEIRASALQFVRKLSGFTHPSHANAAAFDRAVDEITDVARRLLASLSTASPAKNREAEAMKARERAKARFA